jgi:N-acyl-D-amino-acid deacylase
MRRRNRASRCPAPAAARSDSPVDVLIRHGRIVDGTGAPWYFGDIAIRDGKITAIGKLDVPAKRVLDASGMVVAPGFIDMLGQSEFNVLVDNRAASKILQGVTPRSPAKAVL